jgi:hypothetical protein
LRGVAERVGLLLKITQFEGVVNAWASRFLIS